MNLEISSITCLPLGVINLSDDEHQKVVKCIANYTYDPNGVAEQISYIIYIAIEDIKHLFNQSDWDKAVKSLNQKSTRVLPALVVRFLPDSAIQKTSEYGLRKLIQVNHYKNVYVPQSMIDYVEQSCTVDNVVKAIGKYIESL